MYFENQEITMFYKNQSYKLNERNQNDLIFDPIFTFRQQIISQLIPSIYVTRAFESD